MKYISDEQDEPQFYSSYGTFMHRLIERFLKGEAARDELVIEFLTEFHSEVLGERPAQSTVQKYIQQGVTYLRTMEPFPFNTLAVEKEIFFEIDGIPFVGIVDYVGERDGKIYIVDNKSRDLKPRGKKRTRKDDELDEMLGQLYLYSAGIFQEYGRYPDYLCFNCYRTGEFITEPFQEKVFIETLISAKKCVREIEAEEEFAPRLDYFSCRNICGVRHECCYYDGR